MQLFNSAALAIVAFFAGQTLATGCKPVDPRGLNIDLFPCPRAGDSWSCDHSSTHVARMADQYVIVAGDAMHIELYCNGDPSVWRSFQCDANGSVSTKIDCPTDEVTVQTWEFN
ncbi:hypothetical protein E4U55_000391 [Claviceps digitariae]|nr:hypothetical protein E4U55_000391 [Claviceps digitariae]